MVAKALWASVLVVGLLALGGLGYSAVELTQNVTINGQAGTWSVAFTGDFNYLNDTSYGYVSGIGCSGPANAAGVSGSTLTVTSTNMGPGDWCEVFGNISNTGSVPVTFQTISVVTPDSCWNWVIIHPTFSTVLYTGNTLAFQVALKLAGNAPNSCQGQSGVLSVTFGFNAGASTNGEPPGL
jgi:hypothetical protein